MKKELYIKRGLRHANKALENILENEIIQSKSLKGITKENKRLRKGIDYLTKGMKK